MNAFLRGCAAASCLALACLSCGRGEESAPGPAAPGPQMDAGHVGTGPDAAAPDTADCQADADCPGEEDVCLAGACQRCGPARARVQYIYDGDTLILEGGARVRLLLVNTPEVANKYTGEPAECYGDEALAITKSLLLGQTIDLDYDVTCRDKYDRLLAWISLDGLDVNAHLLERGAARVMFVAPNGASRYGDYRALERAARDAGLGLWTACE